MDYFGYVSNISPYFMYLVQQAVNNQKAVAIARYKGGAEEALDSAFMHILRNYDEDKSVGAQCSTGLQHYAARVVSTINRSRYAREVQDDTVLTLASNEEAISQEQAVNPENIQLVIEEAGEFQEDVNSCVMDLLPYFLEDYECFTGSTQKPRKLNYSEILKRYDHNPKIFVTAVKQLGEEYAKAKYLSDLGETQKRRVFPTTKYLQNTEKYIRYVGEVNGICSCEVFSYTRKFLYNVNIFELIDQLCEALYCVGGKCRQEIAGKSCFVTLSGGRIVEESKEDLTLRSILEDEIIGLFLSRNLAYRVVLYEKGNRLLISSSRDEEPGFAIDAFGSQYILRLNRLIMRRISKY